MTLFRKSLATSVAALGLVGFAGTASAVGTLAGTDVSNTATVNYSVGGVPQTEVESSPQGNAAPGAGNGVGTVFNVDRVLNLDVTTVSDIGIPAGYQVGVNGDAVDAADIQYALVYNVTNLGNDTQDILLNLAEKVTGTVDDVDGTAPAETDAFDTDADYRVFFDSNNNGVFDAADTELTVAGGQTFLDEVAPDEVVPVYVIASIPAAQAAGDEALVNLAGQLADGGDAGNQGAVAVENNGADQDRDEADPADNGPLGGTPGDGVDAGDIYMDNVFGDVISTDSNGDPEFDFAGGADTAENGQASDTAAYFIASGISVQKTSTVIEDPFNGTTNPKRIPGAIIEYTITVVNLGTATATDVVVSDPLPAQTLYVGDSVVINGTATPDADAAVTAPADGTNGTLSVEVPDIAGAGTATVVFQVEID